MDFRDTEQQAELRQSIRAFCATHCDSESEAAREQSEQYPADLHRALAAAGLLGLGLPRDYGGGGLDLLAQCIAFEELSRHSGAAANILFINGVCGALVAAGGSPAQREALLGPLCAGELRFAFALTESEAGSDLAGLSLTAQPRGEDYVLSGSKLYTTGAADAHFLLTAARSDAKAGPRQGISLFLVPADSAGLEITALPKLAGNEIASCRVAYRDVQVSSDARLGEANGAWSWLMLGGALERLSVAASCLGLSRAILDAVLAHAAEREQFGQPIGRFQAVQHRIADMSVRIEAMQWLVYAAAQAADLGAAAQRQICSAKLFAAENAQQIAQDGMRLLGGRAYFSDNPMQRRLREALLALYAGGTMEIQRNLIARSLGL
ncbi:acyl-CoA dehydrogenase [Mangrovimicrobium sediminis]|uniref:Acyl-CoA dehydrogenase n=1 Tax=Mangrovimicrobium sediminis TaxID=2562682 RepID=A0A4Z0LUL9_9GAMM|nr:acyl-CoA dehydrogenase family protein [Haliea sp. SAOS-164]TGD70969.1 acyl-CoA dehydrogenase [Haliea sp. SAOS-164]